MIIYVSILFISILLYAFGNIERHSSDFAYYSMLLILSVFAGSRQGIGGYDYLSYQGAYLDIPCVSEVARVIDGRTPGLNFEPLFLLTMSFLKTLGYTYNDFLLAFSIITIGLTGYGLKKISNDYFFIFILYLMNSFLWQQFTIIRQGMACCIFINIIPFAYERRPIPYFAGVLLAATMHISALILLPLYIVFRKRLSLGLIIVYIGLVFGASFGLKYIMNFEAPSAQSWSLFIHKLAVYLNTETGEGVINPLQAVECLVVIFLCLPLFRGSRDSIAIDCGFKLTFCLLLIAVAFYRFSIFVRFLEYFKIGVLLLFSEWRRDRYKELVPVKTSLVLGYFMIKYFRYLSIFDNGSLMPYSSFLFNLS
jgi:hypothetical protein